VLVIALRDPSSIRMVAPPVGAGAGHTGGANAIGEYLAGHKATYNANAAGGTAHQSGEQPKDPPKPGNQDSALESGATKAQPGDLVQPESLPQGFILVVEDKGKRATQSSPIYLASNLYSNWAPGSKESMLTPQSDMKWRIDLAQPEAWKGGKTGPALAFKFTRGTWELEELNEDLSKPGNRTLPKVDASRLKPGEKPVIEMSVAKWGDMAAGYKPNAGDEAYVPVKATGDLRRLQIVGGSGGAESLTRECLVWLPPGYDDPANASTTYPVLYLHDGQNLFARHGGIPAEWGADETAARLIAEKKVPPFIIVGLPHGGNARMSEYLPVPALPNAARPAGDAYIAFLLAEVKPRVERAFRVATDRYHVGIGGSSLGAAIALRAGALHPTKFGLVLAESPPLETGLRDAWKTLLQPTAARSGPAGPGRVFIGFGAREYGTDASMKPKNEALAEDVEALAQELRNAGAAVTVVREDTEHTESAWAARLPRALEVLFGKAP
jgi:enterochelin esterase-like enzyme